jgi:membrane protein YqaA with SNARE-associated domain
MMASIHAVLLIAALPRWIRHLRGLGLLVLGLADNSVIPLPGSMDVLTIWLAAGQPKLWPYYAAMATLGAVIGGYITYNLARKGGKEAFEKRVPKRTATKVYKQFERWGFWAIAVPAMIPPPFPIVPFLLAAGAMQYSHKKFLGALAVGRGIRFLVVAGLGALYGNHIVSFFSKYYLPALLILVGLAVVTGGYALYKYLKSREAKKPDRAPRRTANKVA